MLSFVVAIIVYIDGEVVVVYYYICKDNIVVSITFVRTFFEFKQWLTEYENSSYFSSMQKLVEAIKVGVVDKISILLAKEKKREFLESVKKEIENAKATVQVEIPNLKFDELLNNWEYYINKRYFEKLGEQKFMEEEQQKLKAKWSLQKSNSKWIHPVQSCGDLRCAGGHTLNNTVVCWDCKNELFWTDVPTRSYMCKGCDMSSKFYSLDLKCIRCKEEAYCKIRCTGSLVVYICPITFVVPKSKLSLKRFTPDIDFQILVYLVQI
ncbi:hypothetical protein PPL_10848 [Heterostelium album PN500]|uniref:Uncharacterized protein n=1 Tax=Heterostelium pallidum (strain ATCC 26659 / Pp 5 / PN500) TaxID=670386 RepID=D3BS56_HETP5|nr:hypothetical protein PPL_10848 [Heterostelium album PN500]EFA75793.1 hypothetical protein PPL_10848 [Heterostelium album PN500]|eukprot:XP_020427927.1 hypothetical protein PPL_10848 [Heterostelium album PN500]